MISMIWEMKLFEIFYQVFYIWFNNEWMAIIDNWSHIQLLYF